MNWAMYLGHHWAYRREAGEAQMVYNYVRAFTDYIINFTFARGVHFRSPKLTEAIVPGILKRVWEVDNDKDQLLWEVGQQGGVSGDAFIKVAYEDPWEDGAGNMHPGRVRVLPLNAAHSFPEFHPHDRQRLLRFKLKYRFWGCVDTETEALTRRGWLKHDQLQVGDEVLALDPVTDAIRWEPVEAVNVYDYDGEMVRWSGKIDAVTTPNHRWLADVQHGAKHTTRYQREIVRTRIGLDGDTSVPKLRDSSRLVVGGGTPLEFPRTASLPDEVVETVAWYLTEGTLHTNQTGVKSVYLGQKRPEGLASIRRLADYWRRRGATFSEYAPKKRDGVVEFYLGNGVKQTLFELAPDKALTPEFLGLLTHAQAELFYEALLNGDGHRRASRGSGAPSVRWTQLDQGRRDGFQMLCAMLGKRTASTDPEKVQVYQGRYIQAKTLKSEDNAQRVHLEDGKVWCPSLESGIWFARRHGNTYWTGNTSLEGTRQVYTYTEIMTDNVIEEYINDELIDSRPNPLGIIPVVHIPNTRVSGSPWGLSDCHDVIGLNRNFNEVATDIADIINYHAAPVTVIVGAKTSQLEKGPRKVWGGLPKDAKVFNLEGGAQGLDSGLKYLELLKLSMHEMVGIPETALGQMQPISNTSGVALSIQFQPLMNRWYQKTVLYREGMERVNEVILRYIAWKEPWALEWNESYGVPPKPGQLAVLDPQDPATYRSIVHFMNPLPLDKLIALNEIQAKIAMGLESKEGALRALGEEFPAQKLHEIQEELLEDARGDGVLLMVKAQVAQAIQGITGFIVSGGDVLPDPNPPLDANGNPVPTGSSVDDPVIADIGSQLLTEAYGTKEAQYRNPDKKD